MARTWRRRLRRGVMYSVMAGLLSGTTFGIRAEGDGDTVGFAHVRSTTPAIARLLSEGSARSGTFRQLVAMIERTDGIVYVEPGVCRHGVRACMSLSITPAGGYRILRVLVNLATNVIELMATIGHELRHALEILADPGVRTSHQAYMYYLREAPTVLEAFETPAAIEAGIAVRRELVARR
jgi:hypothetical protein